MILSIHHGIIGIVGADPRVCPSIYCGNGVRVDGKGAHMGAPLRWGEIILMTHQTAINEALHLNQFSLGKEAVGKFNLLIDLVLKWSQTINITAHRNPSDIIYKDIIDNLYLAQFIVSYVGARSSRPTNGGGITPPLHIIDMGAGAGFSGIVLSIVNPAIKMTFLESDRKKINFIKEVCRKLALPQMQGTVFSAQTVFIHARAESYPKEYKETFNCSITRATWPLEEYLGHVHYYVQNTGYALYMYGKKTKNHGQQMLNKQGFAGDKEFFYNIEPKKYERSIFSFKKISF